MEETPREPPLQPGERVEHHEVTERVPQNETERTPPGREVRSRRGTPMWAWLIPLVIVVLFLAWYVLTSGEPSSPIGGTDRIELEVPEIDPPNPAIENNTVIELPDAPAAPEPSSAPPAAPTPETGEPADQN